ncbi:peptidoglycan/xylan/chitin deacetylase (PgdA/CDA1 family) [Clostridium tetanomorphum]|uniref:Polysaccharide deacetylase family protein n=1 Tax=Clostridium tetanomorphum TaxID=1553 RepID=A0A923J1I6_CLOTT|nr:polysaccharide deacetylase family protein [Clostridium tetanomorphum]KAJ49956.1 polysaccharide deacetylase [Clostridium tetanomorphum DSM 665]MBC2399281.1 polysaccharide deacetylase family protein [Clostridium tetanomorphum]MBP1866085.1 peptidoglycan/xylan/chitin deacetylase (PgdA/CDA1 family) [Clostridium tetanomorphum]NRS86713.1 peptidoglycan/xylan/chitin deacetylase (PgdA/CDA1 family) [Clostridium tetanomorphum]NRZ99534.1 peptidoglycan/xylan/chitin deacetylase (PgdA/CDA1 family) [Clostri
MANKILKKFLLSSIIFIFPIIPTSCSKNLDERVKNSKHNNTQVINNKINNTEDSSINNNNPNIENEINKPTNRNFNNTSSNHNFKYNDKGIPVLMYHSIAYEKGNELRIPKEIFKEQMLFLKENNYTTLTLDEVYEFFINNKPIPEKSVVITFDDGYNDNYTNAYPILKELNFNAVIFVVTDTIDKDKNCLTSEEIIEMNSNGIEIQSHTQKHEKLPSISYKQQLETLKNSKNFLESILNKKVDYIAYPYGLYNDSTIKALKELGFKMGFSTSGTWSDKTDGIYSLDRVYISANFNMKEFKRRLTNRNYK